MMERDDNMRNRIREKGERQRAEKEKVQKSGRES